MDTIKLLLSTKRNIITLVIIGILAIGLLVGLWLVQQQTQLKSKAATALEGEIWDIQPNPVNKVGGNWQQMTISVGANDQNWQLLFYNPGTCSKDSCPLAGWSVIGTGNDDKVITWNPPSQVTGPHSFALFDGAVSIIDVKDVNFIEPAQPTPTSTPPASQTVTIRGTLKRSDSSPFPDGHQVNILYDGNNHFVGTASNGQFSLDVPQGKLYAVRPNDFPGYAKKTDSSGNCGQDSCGTYENQKAGGSPDCASSCNFTYTPFREARCTSFSIKDSSGIDVTTGLLYQNQDYTFNMTMTNLGATVWKRDTHKLKSVAGENTIDQIFTGFEDSYDMAETSVAKNEKANFSATVIANALPDGVDRQSRKLAYSMNDAQDEFGGYCQRDTIQVNRPGVGGPGASPPPDGINFALDAGGDREITQGSEISQTIEAERLDVNPTDVQVTNIDASGLFPSGVTHSLSSRSCDLVRKTATTSSTCRVSLRIHADENAQTTSGTTITVTAKIGELKRENYFVLKVKPKITEFNFRVSAPSDITLTKGQTDPGRDITVTKTAGDAENVTLSVIGDLGGAQYSFKPSPSCKPEDGTCKRKLIFDTSNATPGDYFLEIQGSATGGRSKVSDSFKLTVKPEAAIVTCFVVSTSGNTRSLFKNCNQVTLNNPSEGIIAGFLDSSSQTFDFTLTPGNGSKPLYARFIKAAAGQDINPLTDCSPTSTSCRNVEAGITLAVPAPTPTPTPTPPPVTGCLCQTDNSCSLPCLFEEISPQRSDVTYTTPKKCNPMPGHSITANKNVWCQNRTLRTKGDADGDGKVNSKDYLFLLTGQFNGTLPADVYPDFNGNGMADSQDLIIWQNAPKTP